MSLITDVELLKNSLSFMKEQLLTKCVYLGCSFGCEKCVDQPEGCVDLRNGIEKMIDDGCLRFDHLRRVMKDEIDVITIPYKLVNVQVPVKRSPVTITLPGSILYQSDKALPWKYGPEEFYQDSKHKVESPCILSP